MKRSNEFLENLFQYFKNKGIMDDNAIYHLDTIFNGKSMDIIGVIKRGVIFYDFSPSKRKLWVIRGDNSEYFVYPGLFCSCLDYYKNVVIGKKREACKHLVAQVICEALRNYERVELEDKDFEGILKELELKF